jgi:fructose-bisphosphate aldolase, class II
VTTSSTVIAALEAARDKKSPIILQTSQGGAAYFAGKVRDCGLESSEGSRS